MDIQSLVALARDRSPERRRYLFENMAELLLSGEYQLNAQESNLMGDIMVRLIDTVEADLRRSLAEALAFSGVNMPDLIRFLARDEAPIARPLLEKSPFLEDEDLIAVVRERSDEHRMAVAVRDNLSKPVTEVLVSYGATDVIATLLRNQDAKLSYNALEYLVAESRRIDAFQKPLLARSDLPSELAYRLYWWVGSVLRRYILDHYDLDEAVLEAVIHRAHDNAMADVQGLPSTHASAEALVIRMQERNELTFDFLIGCLRQKRIPVFVAGLARLAQVDYRTALMLFSDEDAESLAILCRSVGMETQQFVSIFLLLQTIRHGERPQSTGVIKRISDLFVSVVPDQARKALRYWQRDSAQQTVQASLAHL